MNLDALIRDQNRQWLEPKFVPVEAKWPQREVFFKELKSSLNLHLILALTGLRRVGKSTLMKQLLGDLLRSYASKYLFYFSFDGSLIKNQPDTLSKVLETYANYLFHKPISRIDSPVFILLDEIQLIPGWQDVLKRYYDMNHYLNFIISGSSSLFISRKSTESLAGRIKEFFIPPLTFREYLTLHREISQEINKDLGLEKYARFYPDQLLLHFEKYLQFGQFPQPVVENFPEQETLDYLQKIENKVLEFDLPISFPVKRIDILRLIFSYFKQNSGNILVYENLTNDLGVDIRTTIKYIDWLKKAFLIDICLNQTKKLVKTSRTAKKIYLKSTNFSSSTLASRVETYVFNLLKQADLQVEFFRFQNQEIDFVTSFSGKYMIPWEVKYREQINPSDLKTLLSFSQRYKCPYAFLISKKNFREPRKIGSTILYQIPASQLELSWEAIVKKIRT